MSEFILTIITSIVLAAKPVYIPMNATAYCLTGTTASGMQTKYGVCATGNKKLMGNEAVLYQRLPDGSKGKYIGTFLIADTGCANSVIDVWKPDIDECQEFMEVVYADGCKGQIWVELRKVE
ncbi:MAG: hypothetical protein MJ197_10135 [Bacteroidales bacterium]|nr:hypothetical protein [Bacteroidales bacterium]